MRYRKTFTYLLSHPARRRVLNHLKFTACSPTVRLVHRRCRPVISVMRPAALTGFLADIIFTHTAVQQQQLACRCHEQRGRMPGEWTHHYRRSSVRLYDHLVYSPYFPPHVARAARIKEHCVDNAVGLDGHRRCRRAPQRQVQSKMDVRYWVVRQHSARPLCRQNIS